MPKFLIVDDHALFRYSFKMAIQSFYPKSQVDQASNGAEALDVLKIHLFDIIFLDVQMPIMNGIEVLKKIKTISPKARPVVLTQFDDDSLISHVLKLGAAGYLSKNSEAEKLKLCIDQVLETGIFHDPDILKALCRSAELNPQFPDLEMTSRELQVVSLVKDGKSNKEISAILKIRVRTVESYRKTVMKKTNCKNAAELVHLIHRTGIS